MNTKTKQNQKKQNPVTRQGHGQKKQGRSATMHHEQESPETRVTR